MGFFSRFWRKKSTHQSILSHPDLVEIFSVESTLIVCDPLAGAPGTSLSDELINGALHSLAMAIASQSSQSSQSITTADDPQLVKEFAAIAAHSPKSQINFLVSELSFSSDLGYSARVGAPGMKLTVLFGAPAPVARAATPFALEIESYLSEQLPENHHRYVLAIDGIAYAALTTKSEWK